MEDIVFDIAGASVHLEAGGHTYESLHCAAIGEDWARRQAANPHLFNGPTVLGTHWTVHDGADGGQLAVTCRAIDYATLVYWLETPGERKSVPEPRALAGGDVHCFANAVITGSDGAILMGRMAGHTYNAGRVYMPSGSFDPSDFSGGKADIEANMRREVLEETGIDLIAAEALPGYRAIFSRSCLALFRQYRFPEAGAVLAERVSDWLVSGGDGELAEVVAVQPGQVDAQLWAGMPAHVRRYMTMAAK